MIKQSASCALSRHNVPIYLAISADHKRKSETAKDLFEQAAHIALARKWARRADAEKWGR